MTGGVPMFLSRWVSVWGGFVQGGLCLGVAFDQGRGLCQGRSLSERPLIR